MDNWVVSNYKQSNYSEHFWVYFLDTHVRVTSRYIAFIWNFGLMNMLIFLTLLDIT